jgi:transcriptional regulator with XRE-family HTH domain
MTPVEIDIGSKIKKLRIARGFRQEDVARMTDLSLSMISQVENNRVSPSIATLKKIASSLGKNTSFFLDEDENSTPPCSVLRKNERKLWPLSPKIHFYLLTPNLNRGRKIELMWNVIKTGGVMETPYTHEGEECGVIIQGRLEFTIGNQTCILEEGDSIYFDASIPHRWRNDGKKDVHVVWAVTPPTL